MQTLWSNSLWNLNIARCAERIRSNKRRHHPLKRYCTGQNLGIQPRKVTMEYTCADLLDNILLILGDDSKWRTVDDFVIRSGYYNGRRLYNFSQLRAKDKSKMRKLRSPTLYMLLTPTMEDVTLTLILLWSKTLLEFKNPNWNLYDITIRVLKGSV